MFLSEQSCRKYLEQIRWHDGFACPRCEKKQVWKMSRDLHLCTQCRGQISVTVGTLFQDTHLPLQVWFEAIGWMRSQKTGVSA